MISSMREYFASLKVILVIIILAFIATSVIYFGSSALSGMSSKAGVITTVNGEEIPPERFRRAQSSLYQSYEQMTKQKLTPEMAERLGVVQQVINEVVSDAVIVQAAAREGVQVTDEELRALIRDMKEFQEDGRFSRDRYLRILKQARLEAGEFESELRRQYVRRKIEHLVKDGVKVSDAELRDAWMLGHEQVRGLYASLDAQPLMAGVQVSDADIDAYLKGHQPQFTRPERRRLQYVLVTPGDLAQPVTDQDVEAYYKEHRTEFERPPRVHVAHVLVRVPPVGGSEAENGAKAKIAAVIKRAQAGEDFGKLAREVSEDTSNAAQGGDLGMVGRGELVPQFEQAAFALKKGEVSPQPVRTPFGYHAIKVTDVQEGGTAPLKDVAAGIRAKLIATRSDAAARDRADKVRSALLGAKDFGVEAKTLGLEARDAIIAKGEPLGAAGREAALDDAVFGLAVGGVSSPVKTRAGYAIVKVMEQIPAGLPPLAEIRPRIVEAVQRERAETLATDRAKALVASVAKGGDFVTTAKADGFATGETPAFSRADPPKDRATLPGNVLLTVIETPLGRLSDPVRAGTTVYVVKTVERQAADPQGFEKDRAPLEQQLLARKRNQVWDNWVKERRATAKVDLGGQALPPPR